MKKIILALLIFLIPVICLASGLQNAQRAVIAKKNTSTCNPATNEIGDRTTTYTASINSTEDDAICVYAVADCTGTLGYAYIVHDGTGNDNAKICVYQDNGSSATNPDSTDDILSGMTCRTVTSSTDGEQVQTASKLGGAVTNGTGYFICVIGDSTVWTTEYESTGTTRRFSFTNNQFPYAAPPATLSTEDTFDVSASLAVFVAIE